MIRKETKVNVFEYNDFRRYLSDWYEARHAEDPSLSKSEVCRLIGLPNSRNFFAGILQGNKISKTFLDRFIALLGLDTDESRFFTVLVKFNQAEESGERELYFDQLIALNRTPKTTLTERYRQYYSQWHHGVVRALIAIIPFTQDYAALARMIWPPITPKLCKDSVKLLQDLELIQKEADGIWKPTQKAISTPPYAGEEYVRNYQLKCLDLAKHAIMHNRTMPQSISTNTLYVSAQGYQRIQKRIEKLRSEVRSLVHKDSDPADRVCQLDILLFPNSIHVGEA